MSTIQFSTGLMEVTAGPIQSLMVNNTHPFQATHGPFNYTGTSTNKVLIIYKGTKPTKATIAPLSRASSNPTYNSANILITFVYDKSLSAFVTYNATMKKMSSVQLTATASASGTATHFIMFSIEGSTINYDTGLVMCGDVTLPGGGGDLLLNGLSLDIVAGQPYSCKFEFVIPYEYTY